MRKKLLILVLAVFIGVLDALILKAFEFIVNDGSNYIWNDLFHTDVNRWGVVPLAISFSLILSILFRWTRQKRLVPPKLNSTEADETTEKPTLKSLGVITVIGLASLLAGASLGPEASLVAIASGLGLWMAYRNNLGPTAKLLELASISGLLVAFFGSMIIALMPLLFLWQKKQLKVATALPALLAAASAYGTLWLIDPEAVGYGTIPAAPHFKVIDFGLALIVGFAAALLGWALKYFILKTAKLAKTMNDRLTWVVSAAIFGLVIGLLYWAGGQSIQFSGSEGSRLLLDHAPAYGLGTLLVILVTKLLATGWSLATGYRGGLVFPSVFIGLSIALIAENISGDSSVGILLGAVAGVFSAMLGPVVGLIFISSIIPIKLVGIAIAGIAGAFVGNKLMSRLAPKSPATSTD